MSGLAITVESAQVGYLVSEILSCDRHHVTYYANSLEEAFSGAVRLVWTYEQTLGPPTTRTVGSWCMTRRRDCNATSIRSPNRATSGSFVMFGSPGRLQRWSTRSDRSPLVCAGDSSIRTNLPGPARGGSSTRHALRDRRESSAARSQRLLAHRVTGGDIHVFGENLVDFQVPFGCFSMSPAAYAVWNNPLDAMAQTSTFAAKCDRSVPGAGHSHEGADTSHRGRSRFWQISSPSRRLRNDYFHRHSNPPAADLMEAFGLDLDSR